MMIQQAPVSVLTSTYRAERHLEAFLTNVTEQSVFPNIELLLRMNDPSSAETSLVRDFMRAHPGVVRLSETREVESLGLADHGLR